MGVRSKATMIAQASNQDQLGELIMQKVWLDKGFGVHATSWMRPINRENRAVMAVRDHVAWLATPELATLINRDLDRNDLNGLSMILFLQDLRKMLRS